MVYFFLSPCLQGRTLSLSASTKSSKQIAQVSSASPFLYFFVGIFFRLRRDSLFRASLLLDWKLLVILFKAIQAH